MTTTKMVSISLVSAGLMIGAMMYGMPQYSVWQQEMAGKAALAKATQDRQIKIEEAKAVKESAQYQSEAEIIRARGVAEANKIIGQSLNNNEAYLRYLWVNSLGEKDDVTTIYIPTEGQMPLMKAVK